MTDISTTDMAISYLELEKRLQNYVIKGLKLQVDSSYTIINLSVTDLIELAEQGQRISINHFSDVLFGDDSLLLDVLHQAHLILDDLVLTNLCCDVYNGEKQLIVSVDSTFCTDTIWQIFDHLLIEQIQVDLMVNEPYVEDIRQLFFSMRAVIHLPMSCERTLILYLECRFPDVMLSGTLSYDEQDQVSVMEIVHNFSPNLAELLPPEWLMADMALQVIPAQHYRVAILVLGNGLSLLGLPISLMLDDVALTLSYDIYDGHRINLEATSDLAGTSFVIEGVMRSSGLSVLLRSDNDLPYPDFLTLCNDEHNIGWVKENLPAKGMISLRELMLALDLSTLDQGLATIPELVLYDILIQFKPCHSEIVISGSVYQNWLWLAGKLDLDAVIRGYYQPLTGVFHADIEGKFHYKHLSMVVSFSLSQINRQWQYTGSLLFEQHTFKEVFNAFNLPWVAWLPDVTIGCLDGYWNNSHGNWHFEGKINTTLSPELASNVNGEKEEIVVFFDIHINNDICLSIVLANGLKLTFGQDHQ